MKKMIGITAVLMGIVIGALSLMLKAKGHMSMVIGGADGPTSVFVAGKLGGTSAVMGMIAGMILLIAGIFMIARK